MTMMKPQVKPAAKLSTTTIAQHVPDDDPDYPVAAVIDLESARIRRKRVE